MYNSLHDISKIRKVAYLILGYESSGTRMLTEVLVRAGIWGQYTHMQEMDDLIFKGRPNRIVFRRSLPHNRIWPNIVEIIERIRLTGYQVIPIVIVRDRYACARSQVRHKHVETLGEAYDHMNYAAGLILTTLCNYNPIVIAYEKFIDSVEYRKDFCSLIGIELPKMKFYNANTKYCKSGS